MHCFTESVAVAKAAIEMNFLISLSGIVTFKNATQVHDVAREIALDHLMIETDSPFLAPAPHRGKTNEPFVCCLCCAQNCRAQGLPGGAGSQGDLSELRAIYFWGNGWPCIGALHTFASCSPLA